MGVGALALLHAADQFVIPCIALVRVDMSLFEDIALLVQDRFGGELTDQVAFDTRVAVRRMLMSVGLRDTADKFPACDIAV